MSIEELQTLKSFKISNAHGSIEFDAPAGSPGLDITQVNLARDFIINKRGVQVLEAASFKDGETKPAPGQKLNVPALITLFKVPPKGSKTPAD